MILDFSNKAIPVDAEIDAPYTQADCDYMEPNDTFETAMPISPTDMGPAAICKRAPDAGLPDDADFYKFTVPQGTMKVTVTVTMTNRPGGDLDLRLHQVAMDTFAQSRGFTDTEQIVCPGASPACPALTPGSDYVMEVFPAVAGYVNSYTFSVQFQ